MTTKRFSTGDAISFGWSNFKSNIGLFLGIMIILALLSVVFSFIENNLDSAFLRFIISIIRFVVMTFVGFGCVKISLNVHDKKQTAIGDLFSCSNILLSGLIGSFIFSLMTGIGFILLIVPGIFLFLMFQFFGFFIVDKELGPIDAFKRSQELTSGVKMDLFLFDILIFVLNIVGVICLVIGLFVTIPISILASGYVYRKLSSEEEKVKPETPSEQIQEGDPTTE